MSICQSCKSDRIARVQGKCSDMCSASIGDHEKEGEVPGDMEIGHGDYIDVTFCADCGQIQGVFPLPPTELEVGVEDDLTETSEY